MRGYSLTFEQECTWNQCLYAKDDHWAPEPGDEDFEIAAKHCFVTGISKHGTDEFDAIDFQPIKHGVDYCMINNVQDDPVSATLLALRFPEAYNEQGGRVLGLTFPPGLF